MEQIDIFEMGIEYHYRPPLYFDRPIRLFEAFAGVGCQAMAFRRAGIPFVSVGISEIDKYSLKSYKAIHGEMLNYGDICAMETIPPCDVFTWSFPCTDLSKAGKRKGMTEDTRSGLVYEVLRLLKSTEQKPKCLIMENVPDLVQEAFKAQFYEIQKEIESHGYKNFTLTLNAKEYGVAQNRDRVFMVSLLGDYHYEFPMPFPLTKRLKDYLEKEVDEKYYLSPKAIEFFQKYNLTNEEKGRGFKFDPQYENGIASTLCGRDFKGPKCVQIGMLEGGKWDKMHDIARRYYDTNGIAPTIHTVGGGNLEPKIVEPKILEPIGVAQRGRNGAQKIEYNRESIANAITTVQKDSMVVEPICLNSKVNGKQPSLQDRIYSVDGTSTAITQAFMPSIAEPNLKAKMCDELIANGKVREYDVIRHSYTNSRMEGKMNDIIQENNMSPTIDTRADCLGVVTQELRIRKLTPRECWRLMGISDDDFDKAQAVCSNSQLYKQAGNGIVVDVFAAILKNLIEYQPKGKE